MERTDTITTADGDMGVHVVTPDESDGPWPVVVFFHHGPGLDEGSKQAMARIAAWGYYVISHDRYHRDEPWFVMTPAMRGDEAASKRFWGMLMGTTDDLVDRDITALLSYVGDDPLARPAPMGCIGYCIGARSVLRTLAAHNDVFRVGVALHPSFCTTDDEDSPHLAVPTLEGSLYMAFGSADTMQPASDNEPLIEAVRAHGPGFEVEIHDGADHGFGVPGPRYHAPAADRSYERAEALFAAELG